MGSRQGGYASPIRQPALHFLASPNQPMAVPNEDADARCLDALRRARADLHSVQSEIQEADRLGERHGLRYRPELLLIGRQVNQVGDRIDRLLRARSSACFPGSALVATPGGPCRIASIRRGDLILSWCRRTSTTAARAVTAVQAHGPRALLLVRQEGGGELAVTPNHRMLTSRGWVRVDRLGPGDALVRPDASAQAATVLAVEPNPRVEPVFNLVTAGEHSYIVDGLVAHNFTHLRWLRTRWHRLVLDVRASAVHARTAPTPG